MSFIISEELQVFLDKCNKLEEITRIIVEEPSELMMLQISDSYAFSEKPVLFHFTVTNSSGNDVNFSCLTPKEVWSVMTPIASEMIAAADRFAKVKPDGIFFIKPDIKDSICLKGFKLNQIDNPCGPLKTLINKIKLLEHVESVSVHEPVDPTLLEECGPDGVMIIVNIEGVTASRINEIDDSKNDDSIGTRVQFNTYFYERNHLSVTDNLCKQIAKIR